MNYSSFIVKIIQKPKQNFFDNNIPFTEISAKFYQFRHSSYNICKLSIWGNLSDDVIKYYATQDDIK